ncbi:MAG: MFS transporter [Synechococcaceae cyanobacterium SM2_3_1]|nr:MFS transporter [Synechococcaceae cyanobacterium SM2_3_1]
MLSQTGTGFTLFFIPIFFVDQVGLSPTQVGLGLAAMSVSGAIGRIGGGSLADSRFGRKRTLSLSLVTSALGSLALAITHSFELFIVANLIAGLGQGFYWPATETMVADLTTRAERNEAYALNRLGDNLGLSFGVALASGWVDLTDTYRPLFVVDALSFLVFLGLLLALIPESRPHSPTQSQQALWGGWKIALSDRALLVFALGNILLTTYIAQLSAGLPLYFDQFLDLSVRRIGILFFGHGLLIACLQLPVARLLNRLTRVRGLTLSALAWLVGFLLIWALGMWNPAAGMNLGLIIVALGVLSLAVVMYNPSASALVADLAPPHLRGVYLSVNALCWAAGFGFGPVISGYVLDLPAPQAHFLWLGWAVSVGLVLMILRGLRQILPVHVNATVSHSASDLANLSP